MEGNFIVIDGPDGAGKTTTAENLAKRLGYKTIKTPAKSFREITQNGLFSYSSIDERFNFYLEGLCESQDEILESLSLGEGVVVDRYTSSLGLYHTEMSNESKNYSNIVKSLNFLKPCLEIVLLPPFEILKERIQERIDSNSCFSEHERDFLFLNNIHQRFSNLDIQDVEFIDTKKLKKIEVIEEIVRLLK